jgi:hypothetical protein
MRLLRLQPCRTNLRLPEAEPVLLPEALLPLLRRSALLIACHVGLPVIPAGFSIITFREGEPVTAEQKQAIIREFANFTPPANFAGGCQRSSKVLGFCAHFRFDGKLGRIEQGCRSLSSCEGFNYKFNV